MRLFEGRKLLLRLKKIKTFTDIAYSIALQLLVYIADIIHNVYLLLRLQKERILITNLSA